MQSRCTSVRWLFFQHALNCCTQGSVSRPCRIHLSSAGVSLKLIFNMLFSSGLVSEKSLSDRKDDCVDMRVISSSAPHRFSCCTSPGARVPPAASRPGRSREFRHARCGSQRLDIQDSTFLSAVRQPQAIAHGVQQSESLAIPQNSVPLLPLTDETKSREHAIFSSRVAGHAILKITVSATGVGPDVAFAGPT